MLQRATLALTLVLVVAAALLAAPPFQLALTDAQALTAHGVRMSAATHENERGVRLIAEAGARGETYARVTGPVFQDGRIDVDVAGRPANGASDTARGFIGIAFRVKGNGANGNDPFECFYIRPTNGRADDQLRRNHSTQYISFPDWPWERLRKETPGVYESYADLVNGAWTHLRVEVAGKRARLFVGNATEPTLIVNDLKLPPAPGAVALWIGDETEGFFRNLRVSATVPATEKN